MQSSGSTSSLASRDSLGSSDSFLCSETDPTEDDADVFLSDTEGEAAVPRPRAPLHPRCASSGAGARPGPLGGLHDSGRGKQTEGDLVFAQKCAELQGFVRPLLQLLNGLKRGRYDRGLSSFQQSVAMDRIQRIVGVLQKPAMGEKYLHTLLQVEMMLKLWFPQITPCSTPTPRATPSRPAPASATPPVPSRHTVTHRDQDQLHIPVKKRRLSWSDGGSVMEQPSKQRHLQRGGGGEDAVGQRAGEEAGLGGVQTQTSHWSQPNPTWVHLSPICTPPQTCQGGKSSSPAGQPPAPGGHPATQDSAISSTTTHPRAPQQQQPIRCQSEPGRRETGDSGTQEGACPGRAQSLAPLFNPASGAELSASTRT
ncbi:circadian associated repressor of transcription a [Amia ocellicauda]|uniref:circadian associated repressor of transcription a n=1 Tax=Amia ocellicauda TaxID=2972642 RepID=UPI003463E0E5